MAANPSPWSKFIAPTKTAPPSKVVAPVNKTPSATGSTARGLLESALQAWGMPAELGTWAWQTYLGMGTTDMGAAVETIKLEAPNQPAFQARFPAYKKLAAEGNAMSPAEMINYEQTAKQVFQSAGLPKNFYDTPQELANFMVNHVSTSELQSRVQLAEQASTTAPPDVRGQLQTMFGLDQGHLTAYYLNPDKALPLITQQFTAAQIGAQGVRTGVGQLSAGQALHLAQTGVSDAQAQAGFAKLGQEQGLFEQQVTGEQGIGLDTQLSAQFDNSAAAQLRILRAQQARTAAFQGNAGENVGQQGVGGLGRIDRSAG